MKAKEFYSVLLGSLKHREDITIKRYKIKYKKGEYDFLRIASKEIGPKDKVILIRAGIHGDEIAGPLTILKFANQIVDEMNRAGLKIILYPLGNPSGFEAGLRYNIDGDRGSDNVGNDDFLRYELEDGRITDDIGKTGKFRKWYWASDLKLKIKLPKETKLMHELLKRGPLFRISAVIDLHQDYITPNITAAAYHYAFGNLSRYRRVVRELGKLVPIFRNTEIGAGESSPMISDNQGFIVRHDGTLPDLMFRLGVKHCITVETTGAASLDVACRVNLIWIQGIIELVNK